MVHFVVGNTHLIRPKKSLKTLKSLDADLLKSNSLLEQESDPDLEGIKIESRTLIGIKPMSIHNPAGSRFHSY